MAEWIYGKLPCNWEVMPMGAYASLITDYVANGSFATIAQNVTYRSEKSDAVLIRLQDYTKRFKGKFVYIDDHAWQFLSKSKLTGGEVIISNVGNVGVVFKCPNLPIKMSLAPNCIMLKTSGCDDFFYYWFKSIYGQNDLHSIVSGSCQPKFNKTSFKQLLVPVPPLEEQKRIADYLNTIDDVLENYRNINDNLQKQARALFFKFFRDNADKQVKPGSLGDLIKLKYGKDHKNLSPGKYPVFGSGGVMRYVDRFLWDKESVLIPRKGTLNNVMFVNEPFWSIDTMYYTQMKVPNVAKFVFNYLKQYDMEAMNSGSAVPSLSTKVLSSLPVNLPSPETLEAYENIVGPMYEIIGDNQRKSAVLTQISQELSKKLLIGQIQVP